MSSSRKRKRCPNVPPDALSDTFETKYYTTDRQSRYRSSIAHTSSSATSLYIDSGNCNWICEYCNAFFWYEERCRSASANGHARYNQCCKGGRVRLPFSNNYSDTIINLFNQPQFLTNIRAYNSMFSMTSFGAKIDDSINNGSGPYVFRIEGQIYHWLGTLCPPANEKPRFLQMYIYDTENEVSNRLQVFNDNTRSRLSAEFVSILTKELEECNELVKLFCTTRYLIHSTDVPNFCIRLYASQHALCYDKPTDGCIRAIVNDSDCLSDSFDIIIRNKDGSPQRINKLHPLYMSLQYLLLFIHGEHGWSPDMRLIVPADAKEKNLTMNMYYSYQLHDRFNLYTLLPRGGRLFQQYLVDAYVCIEQGRLDYYRLNQDKFRTEYLQAIHDALLRGDNDGRDIGKRTILPSSFTGGPRYMYKHYQDALAICRVHQNPQYFITFTCNVKWPEIERFMAHYPSLKAHDRPTIIARVFQIKVNSLLTFLKTNKLFGEIVAGIVSSKFQKYYNLLTHNTNIISLVLLNTDLYTIEFQKRGLPHCHMLLWVVPSHKIRNAEDIDNYISAEIPDPLLEPRLYKIVSESMMHGPCGLARMDSPCMKLGVCSKKFPKKYEQTTSFDKNGYARYRRPLTPHSVMKNGIPLDNRFVVPYNRSLSLLYEAHINVEYCGWSMLIKYLFKYISKGCDRIRYTITRSPSMLNEHTTKTNVQQIDEISNFVDGRFICPHEASWRIFNFLIHDRNPPVQVLSVHLEDMQNVYFKDNDHLHNLLRNPCAAKTTLTEWLRNNRYDYRGRHLHYIDYLSDYRWDIAKCWIRRSTKKTPAIGRLIYVHPTCGEAFYLRMLLFHQRGCQTFEDIRIVSGEVCPTFRDACQKLGLLEDNDEWSNAFNEAALWATARELRTLFTHMLLFCEVSNPTQLWNAHWHKMADDIAYMHNIVNAEDLEQYVLYEVEYYFDTLLLLRLCQNSDYLCLDINCFGI